MVIISDFYEKLNKSHQLLARLSYEVQMRIEETAVYIYLRKIKYHKDCEPAQIN